MPSTQNYITQDSGDARYMRTGTVLFNVKNYGALGDGSTDDSAAFLAAITAADGAPVYVPEGDYPVSLSLTDQDVYLTGPGTLVHKQAANVIYCKRTLGTAKTVSSITTVQLGPNTPSSSGVSTETCSKIAISSTLVGISAGDIYHLSSQDEYSWTGALGTAIGSTTQVWKAGYVPVLGIGLGVSISGTISEGNTVTGATSGATGVVKSVANSSVLVFNSVTGDFTNGENLRVNGVTQGTASGTGYIIMAGKLIDTYTTTPKLRKLPTTAKFIVDGLSVRCSGDPDSIVGSANRQPAFQLMGVYEPQVRNFRIKSAWTRCWQLLGCYGGTLDVTVDSLPNNADTSEAAYGYAVEIGAATERTDAKVVGGNCRHGYTTNIYWGGFSFMDPLILGVPKYNTCRDSLIRNALSASFDTHNAAYYTTFDNCVSVRSASAVRSVSRSQGFQNRGFGTTYINCQDIGSVDGFVEAGNSLDAGFAHTIRYIGCIAQDYQRSGFWVPAATDGTNELREYITCTAVGDGSTTNTPYFQSGFYISASLTTLRGCSSARSNGNPYWFIADGAGRFNILDCFADHTDSPSGTSGLRFDGAPLEVNIQNYKVRASALANTPTGYFRVHSGSVTLNVDGVSCVNTTTPPPLVSVTGGSVTVNMRSAGTGVQQVTTVGDAAATLTPRSSKPVQRWNTPLTADRAVTLATTAGTVIEGDSFRIIRTAAATGAFNLNVGTGPLKALAAGQWCVVRFDGSAWYLEAFGSL